MITTKQEITQETSPKGKKWLVLTIDIYYTPPKWLRFLGVKPRTRTESYLTADNYLRGIHWQDRKGNTRHWDSLDRDLSDLYNRHLFQTEHYGENLAN